MNQKNSEKTADSLVRIVVPTPTGVKYHGYIAGDTFYRQVTNKDLMRIFDAWSIHPYALEQIKKLGIKYLVYKNTETNEKYKIDLETVIQRGFKRSFKGGETWYISLRHWNKPDVSQLKLI
jgi:hypothetical protein